MPRLPSSTLPLDSTVFVLNQSESLWELNSEAEALSGQVDYDDYMLKPDIFAALDILQGPNTINRFSTLLLQLLA